MFQVAHSIPALITAGLNVIVQPGAETRGRKGLDMGPIKGILCHHTAGAYEGDTPTLSTVLNGRPDLGGPLAHFVLGRSGDVHFIAGGRCNHAGAGSWHGVQDGNYNMIGIEAENAGYLTDVWNTSDGNAPSKLNQGLLTKDGKTPYIIHKADPWPEMQMIAYAKLCAAESLFYGFGLDMVAGHKEYALPHGRKSDPSFNMDDFRIDVNKWITVLKPSIIPLNPPTK